MKPVDLSPAPTQPLTVETEPAQSRGHGTLHQQYVPFARHARVEMPTDSSATTAPAQGSRADRLVAHQGLNVRRSRATGAPAESRVSEAEATIVVEPIPPGSRWLEVVDPPVEGPVEAAEQQASRLMEDLLRLHTESADTSGLSEAEVAEREHDYAQLAVSLQQRASQLAEQVGKLGPLAKGLSGLALAELQTIQNWAAGRGTIIVDLVRSAANEVQAHRATRRHKKEAPLYPTRFAEDEQWRNVDPADVFSRLLSTRISEGVDPIRDPQHLRLMLRAEMGRLRAPHELKERPVSVRPRGFSPAQEAQIEEYVRQFGVIDALEAQIAAQTRRMFPSDFKFHSQHRGYDDYYKYLQTRYGTARLSVPDEEIFKQLFPSVDLAHGQEPSGSQLQALYTARRCLEAARDQELARMRSRAGMGEMIGSVAVQAGDRAYEAQDYAFLQTQKSKLDGARPALAESSIEEYQVEVPVDPNDPSKGTVMKTESIVVKSGKPELGFHPLRQVSQAIGVRLEMAKIRMRERAQIREDLLGPNERRNGWIIRTAQGIGLAAVLAGLYVAEADRTNVERLNDLFYIARK